MRQPTRVDGHVGGEPELRFTPKGKPVASFSIANRAGQDEHGNQLTNWWRVTVWGTLAESINNLIGKGDFISCEGTADKPYVFQMKDTDGNVIMDDETGYPKMDAKYQLTAWKLTAIEYAERPLDAASLEEVVSEK